jgi:LacI family transcriptional regulator
VSSGRKRLAFVGGPLGIRQVADRLEGAGNAIRETGGVTLEVLNVPNRTIADGREVANALAARPAASRPDAIFAVNDLTALGLMQGLSVTYGIRIPEEIAIIGYDDIEFAESSLIPLSSIRPPHEGFGFAAVDLLVNEMSDDPRPGPKQQVFAPELVVRASSV